MKLIVKLDYSHYLVFPAEQAGIIVGAFASGQPANTAYKDGKSRYELTAKEPLEFSIVEDTEFEPVPEPIEAVQKAQKAATDQWLAEYNRRIAAEKKVNELQEKLDSLKTAVTSETA